MWKDRERIITSIKISTDKAPEGQWYKLGDKTNGGGTVTGFMSSGASWWRHDPLGMSTISIEVDNELYSVGCHLVTGIEWEDKKK